MKWQLTRLGRDSAFAVTNAALRFGRRSGIHVVSAIAVLVLCAFQYGDNNGLNDLPFEKVRPFVVDLAKAQQMAKRGNVDLLADQAVTGKRVRLRGELTDANCFLSTHTHAYDHAFCAKLCVASGSPLIFVPDAGDGIYVVLTGTNGVKIQDSVLNRIGIPGMQITGMVVESEGVRALAVENLE